ncbi:hypothetical protein EST38_g6078 [Candolleomyces aberdarensis]|uniref:Adenylate cyclase n=1 Tax=Candolleomyces aberdarensis TaxID=2316362 RepID=A0A4Q2DIH3_9AGAR|nr:hypothetical protein EST38_g6078 [Candolleomyces aberdarensis]
MVLLTADAPTKDTRTNVLPAQALGCIARATEKWEWLIQSPDPAVGITKHAEHTGSKQEIYRRERIVAGPFQQWLLLTLPRAAKIEILVLLEAAKEQKQSPRIGRPTLRTHPPLAAGACAPPSDPTLHQFHQQPFEWVVPLASEYQDGIGPEHQINLDSLNDMDGIIKKDAHPHVSSPSSGGSDYGSLLHPSSPPEFSDPFSPSNVARQKSAHYYTHRVSPKTPLPPNYPNGHRRTPSSSSGGSKSRPTWVPPQSWEVAQEEGDPVESPGDSSADEGVYNATPKSRTAPATTERFSHSSSIPPPLPAKGRRPRQRSSHNTTFYKIRIYRSNGSSHHAKVPYTSTVAELNQSLHENVAKGGERAEQHKLYLDEGGRERLLNASELPASIVLKKFQQYGYEAQDGIEQLGGEDFPFLFKFCYKSQFLGPPDEDLNHDNFDFIDLTGRSLRTIPVLLHQNAESIISLKLSRNPMLEIPLDFIQSCSTLRELRLSNMAMQKVPASVRHSTTLHRLDLSSNRIRNLEDAYLDDIQNLMSLFVQNNKLESLPWYFGRLRYLHTLNISNNRFTIFPKVVTKMHNLRDLDISFNQISELPEEIGQLQCLERLLLVGNQVARFPNECSQLVSLRVLDCRRNMLSDLTIVLMLPAIQTISADHNAIPALELSIGPNLTTLDVSYNDITTLSLIPGPIGRSPYSLTSLDLSYAKLSSLDDIALGTLTSLRTLKLDHNAFRVIPDTLGDLSWLETLSCSDNQLDFLPSTIGRLQKLEVLDAHHNNLTELPRTMWNCASLTKINVTSNCLGSWHNPPDSNDLEAGGGSGGVEPHMGRKGSSASALSVSGLPPLVHSLEKLYLGENNLTHEVVHPLMIFKELRVLNLSFNMIQELPPAFLRNMVHLEELYLSGNKLTSIPTEDLSRLNRLSTLYLNGNRLQTLPQELGKVKDLTILDVGSNVLRNFNKKLKYLNLSGNNRLQIKSEPHRGSSHRMSRDMTSSSRHQMRLAGFKELASLRVLGLMDVAITTTGSDATVDIPDETDMRRVRTSHSTASGMAYGIADSLGGNEALNVLDLVHEFPCRPGEPSKAIFAMFGRYRPPKGLLPNTNPNKLAKFLHDNFINAFLSQLHTLNPDRGDAVEDALRRTFLKLNHSLFHHLNTLKRKNSQASATAVGSSWHHYDPALQRTGASAVVVYFVDKTMYVANLGHSMAVVSRHGVATCLSRKHDPYDRSETDHIRQAAGWVSSAGMVNDEVPVSRSFGHFNLIPVVNPRPDVFKWELNELDEFVIIANRGLWDYIPYQTAVDIARTAANTDPMIAAQKLRDFAVSYGADGSVMIMVVMVSDIFRGLRSRQPTLDPLHLPIYRPNKKNDITIKGLWRLEPEVEPPTGHLALVFTDIRNSTHLWEVNPGMPTAMRLHNSLLRRYLRVCGGYEVKTEGDAFMVSFPNALSAVWWCLAVQQKLLEESWPLEILECEDGKDHEDENGRLIARGLSVRMGIHSGMPVCEPDPITQRMDYFGSMVNRSARVNSAASGGQIMITADILREINAKVTETESESEYSKFQPQVAVDGIRAIGVVAVPVGEVKLKGFEFTEQLSAIYPLGLEARHRLLKDGSSNSTGSASRVQFSVPQTQELGLLCLRLEALSGGRLFNPLPMRKASIQSMNMEEEDSDESPESFNADPVLLLPPMTEDSSDKDLTLVLDSLSIRIENAITALAQRFCPPTMTKDEFMSLLLQAEEEEELDSRTLEYISSLLEKMS